MSYIYIYIYICIYDISNLRVKSRKDLVVRLMENLTRVVSVRNAKKNLSR